MRSPCRPFLAITMLLIASTCRADTAIPRGFISETLDNGLQVTILPDPEADLVATQVWYHVGSANEDPDSRGFAHLFEHLMFGGTETCPKDAYARLHTDSGGYENAYTSDDETVYVSVIVPERHYRVLVMEADRMANLALSEENLSNEKKIVTEELRRGTENDPLSRVFVTARKAVLGDHPYAYGPIGTKEDIAAATLDNCRRFYDKYYRPGNAHLVIVGPVDGPEAMKQVRELFGVIDSGEIIPDEIPSPIGWSYPDEVVLEEDLPPAETVIYAYPLPGPASEDYWAIRVMAQMLGFSQIDPFRQILVDRRKKAVYAGVEWFFLRNGTFLLFSAAHLPYRRKSTAYRLTEQTLAELSRFNWLDEESLAAAKNTLLRREWQAVYYTSSMASGLGQAAWHFGDDTTLFQRTDLIDAITQEDIREVFKRYVTDGKPVRVYLRPEKVPFHVRAFGWLYPLVN